MSSARTILDGDAHSSGIMDQRFLFSGLALEFAVAFWPISLVTLSAFIDYSSYDALYLSFAEVSILVTAASGIVIVTGVLRRGRMTPSNSQVLVVLSVFPFLGTLVSAWWTVGVASWASMDCGPTTPWKCNLVQAGAYLEYYFFPAIAVPIVTLVWGLGSLAGTQRLRSE